MYIACWVAQVSLVQVLYFVIIMIGRQSTRPPWLVGRDPFCRSYGLPSSALITPLQKDTYIIVVRPPRVLWIQRCIPDITIVSLRPVQVSSKLVSEYVTDLALFLFDASID
jgi:hypothetical protein